MFLPTTPSPGKSVPVLQPLPQPALSSAITAPPCKLDESAVARKGLLFGRELADSVGRAGEGATGNSTYVPSSPSSVVKEKVVTEEGKGEFFLELVVLILQWASLLV
ncbi:UNVERIFIED_CONTAM: hypothetical protein K2H54_060098 [Gekko kuhli]